MAPRLAETNASPVTQAGSDRPERKKSSAGRDRPAGREADAEDDDEVDGQDEVVERVDRQAVGPTSLGALGGQDHR